ncbi:Spc98 family-domain-containing protein [Boeremia exigua]|uniref:Spc98 family-domain-containing protein n=1 Tax=Boeremia exigua TaxID=749465 RepID=UPI001E8D8BBC|nr:Spc98 family-domain-containing protein [Boeremia exigua]KAH6639014.1 Spc98 family-domain-containing protein [Boeremia exigua]
MAQNARIAGLTDELIQSILLFDPATNKQAYKRAKDLAVRGLRGHQYARTNQFDVENSFAGLDEKCRVKNRDDLADALHLRLQRLESVTNKFKPEFLSLLLQLSDRPLENTRIEALDLLKLPSPPPELTWGEILDEDPYSDEDIWKDIDYAVESSGDEQIEKERKKQKKPLTPATSADEDDTYDPELCVDSTDDKHVSDIEAAHFWSEPVEEGTKTEITELEAVRETLFMLAGLQTSLYSVDIARCRVRVSARFKLSHAMAGTVDHLLLQFASVGRDVLRLRQWTRRPSTLPLVQTFEAAVRQRLLDYDKHLSSVQRRYLVPDSPVAVSLLVLFNEVRIDSEQILRLSQIVSDVEPRLLVNPFSHLEELFNQTTLAQMTLQKPSFDFLSTMLFDCLRTYLKPIRRWMENGELGANDETFFVFENDSGSDVASMWHDRYVLRRDAQDQLRSPSFLQPAAAKIFNTGKSVIFLKELGYGHTLLDELDPEPPLDHQTVCGHSDVVPLSPFPELFNAGFESWIRSKYSLASASLRTHLFETQGLMRVLKIFQMLYVGTNGAVFENFANAIFERMDSGHRGWNDRYMLTELARVIFSDVLPSQDAEKIVVRSAKSKDHGRSVKGLATVSVDYSLHWSILNIIQRSAMPIYQQFHTALLQVYRVKYLLQRARPTRSHKVRRSAHLIYKLQHRLTWFVDMLRSYYTETVVAFTSRDMEIAMEKAEDIDQMADIHVRYVAKLQERAMLSSDLTPIHKAVVEILDLGVLFAKAVADLEGSGTSRARPSAPRRKSSAPLLDQVQLSDTEDEGEDNELDSARRSTRGSAGRSPTEALQAIDKELARLLPFVTAGLRSVGRVGAEPMWEQLAERLEWEGKKDRY